MDDPALLTTQVYKSEAYQIYLRLHTFGLNYYVFTKNYEEIRSILIKAQSTEAFYELWTGEKQQELLLVTRELIRRFHKFLASAKTLVDHTRSLIDDHYQDTSFYNEYQLEKNNSFVGNPLTGFVEELRNYALHYQLPFTGARYSPDKINNTMEFVLITDDLRKWSNWTIKGKPYLEKAEDMISVLKLVDEYFTQINDFQNWMIKRIEEFHKNELSWLREMESKVQNALKLKAS